MFKKLFAPTDITVGYIAVAVTQSLSGIMRGADLRLLSHGQVEKQKKLSENAIDF